MPVRARPADARRIKLCRDARDDAVRAARDELALEEIGGGVDDRDVLTGRKPQHACVLQIVRRQAQRKLGFRLLCNDLVFQEEMMQ